MMVQDDPQRNVVVATASDAGVALERDEARSKGAWVSVVGRMNGGVGSGRRDAGCPVVRGWSLCEASSRGREWRPSSYLYLE